jgi:hypothetical protein
MTKIGLILLLTNYQGNSTIDAVAGVFVTLHLSNYGLKQCLHRQRGHKDTITKIVVALTLAPWIFH